MSTDSLISASCVIAWFIVHCIFLPLDIIWFKNIWKYRFSLIILKRKPKMLLVQLVSLWICLFIFQTISIPSYFGSHHYEFIGYVQALCATPFLIINFLMSFSRYWLLFYMINWNSSMKDDSWQSIIDPQNKTQDWYLRYRKTWGSWKWIRPKVSIIGFICYLCIICCYLLYEMIGIHHFNVGIWILWGLSSFMVAIILVICPGILYQYMYKHIPKLHDEIGLKKEVKASLLIFCLFIIMEYVLIGVYFFFHEYQDKEGLLKILFQIGFVIIRILFSLCNWRHSQYIISHYNILLIGNHTEKEIYTLIHQKTFIKLDDMSSTVRSPHADASVRTQMRDILMESKMFDGFMRQLLKEYCSECLLSIIEMIQFKEKISKEKLKGNGQYQNEKHLSVGGIIQSTEESDIDQFLILSEKCPKSYIVYGAQHNDYKFMVKQLYNKYIRIGATYEINIDYAARDMYRNLIENELNWTNNKIFDDPKKLYYLFNPCIEHMISLICSSFTRFRQSNEYRILKKYSPPSSPQNVLKGFNILQQASSLFEEDEDTDDD